MTAREKLYAIASFIVDSYRHDPELMKVIIVEVTRAANSFGQTHLAKIREAYDLIADDRAQGAGGRGLQVRRHARLRRAWPSTARSSRCSRAGSSTLLPTGDEEFEQAKRFVVETICGGLEAESAGNTPATPV